MAQDKFIWLAGDTFTRSSGARASTHLEHGKTYDAAAFEPAVLAEWVRAGAAAWADKPKAKKEE